MKESTTNIFRPVLSLIAIIFMVPFLVQAQAPELERVEPAFWWTDMHHEELQLLVYGENIGTMRVELNYPGVELKEVRMVKNPNYLFIYLNITEKAEPGRFPIIFRSADEKLEYDFQLKQRNQDRTYAQGFDASDVIYLMMPDRFANGNTDNDTIDGMLESADRSDLNAWQGGDIEGVIENLDYIKNLGMTAIWFTPTFENDMPASYGAYHGYAATDMYKIDRRFGTNKKFRELVRKTHEKGMKVIMDMIHNHIGDHHWWMDDLPTDNWLNNQEKYGNTNYRTAAASDPYASEYDRNKLEKGWFVTEMPDLNQRNELLTDYLKQNTIWWIESAGIDGIRMDTYPYPDKNYMAEWSEYILEAYPDFNIVGEAWANGIAIEGFWQDGDKMNTGYDSNLPNVTDFPLQSAFVESFTTNSGWKSGLEKMYYTLAQDIVYTDPMKNVIFLDNHDITRYYTQVGEDKASFKMGYAMLMTMRGIPQVYYGTELMFENRDLPKDAGKRPPMPGGWPDDERNVFIEEGRTDTEQEIFEYVTNITNWRKKADVIHTGTLTHFIPHEQTYVYFRHNNGNDEAVMVVINRAEESKMLDKNRYDEFLDHYSRGTDIITGRSINDLNNITVPARKAMIIGLE